MEELFASDIRTRIAAAKRFTLFANGGEPPRSSRPYWQRVLDGRQASQGDSWPQELVSACSPGTWPQFAFGTANAPILVVWHRPGLGGINTLPFIQPHTPNLGGVPNVNIVRYVPDVIPKDKSWDLLRKWLGTGLETFKLKNPWCAVMVVCLNPQPGPTGSVDRNANREALSHGGRLDHICRTTRPLLVIACGGPVRDAIHRCGWSPPNSKLIEVDHPTAWEGYGSGRRDGPDRVVPLFQSWARTGKI